MPQAQKSTYGKRRAESLHQMALCHRNINVKVTHV